MTGEHHLIFIPGLGRNVRKMQFAIDHFWQNKGLTPHLEPMDWHNLAIPSAKPRIDRVIARIRTIHQINPEAKVSFCGISAGVSVVGNVIAQIPGEFYRAALIGGRMREGNLHPLDWRTLTWAASRSPGFRESVQTFEQAQKSLSAEVLERILVLRPALDEVVPRSTNHLPGAKNRYIPMIEHDLANTLAVTFRNKEIIDFLLA